MSLAYHLSPDARLDQAGLDPELQEDVLDEMERLCAAPSLIPAPLPDVGISHFLHRQYGDVEYALRLRLDHDTARRRLSLIGVSLLRAAEGDLP